MGKEGKERKFLNHWYILLSREYINEEAKETGVLGNPVLPKLNFFLSLAPLFTHHHQHPSTHHNTIRSHHITSHQTICRIGLTSHVVNETLDELDLRAYLDAIINVRVGPPVPASLGIVRNEIASLDVWVQHYNVVGLCPVIVTSVLGVLVADERSVLLASMKGHVQGASVALLAGGGNVHIANIGNARGR